MIGEPQRKFLLGVGPLGPRVGGGRGRGRLHLARACFGGGLGRPRVGGLCVWPFDSAAATSLWSGVAAGALVPRGELRSRRAGMRAVGLGVGA